MVFWLPLRHSRWLCRLRWLQNGCAMLALWHVHLPIALRIAALLLILLYVRRQTPLPQALLFEPHAVQLFYADLRLPARVGAQCFCSEFLVVLRVEPEQGLLEEALEGRAKMAKRWLVLLPDSSNRDALRRLRVYLRWHAHRPT